MKDLLQSPWSNQQGRDIAEYGVILAVILVLVIGTPPMGGQQRQQCVLFSVEFSSLVRGE